MSEYTEPSNEDVKPLSSFYSTALSPRVTSYDQLATRIAYALGYPLVNVEVHTNAVYDNISVACEMFAKFAGYTEEFLVFDSELYEPGKGVRMDKLFSITPDLAACYDTGKQELATECCPEDTETDKETITGYNITCSAVITSTDGTPLTSTEILCVEPTPGPTTVQPGDGSLAKILAASLTKAHDVQPGTDDNIEDTSETEYYDYGGDWTKVLSVSVIQESLRQRIADLIAGQQPVCNTITTQVTGTEAQTITGSSSSTSNQPIPSTSSSLAPILAASTSYNFTTNTTGTTGVTAADGSVYTTDPYDEYPSGPVQYQTITSTVLTSDTLQVPVTSIVSTTECTPVTSLTEAQLNSLTATNVDSTTVTSDIVSTPASTTITKTTTGTTTLTGDDGTTVECITSIKLEPTISSGTTTACLTSVTTEEQQPTTTTTPCSANKCLYSIGYDYDLNDYRKVIDVWSFTQGTHTGVNTLFTLEQSLAQQTYFSYAMGNYGFDLVSWYAVKEWLELREKLLCTRPSIMFNERTQYLKLIPEPRTSRYYGVVACYVEAPVRDLVKNIWVYQYALALTKMVVGRVRGKFTGTNLIGGGNLDGDTLVQEGKEEKERLETELYENAPGLGDNAPPQFFVA